MRFLLLFLLCFSFFIAAEQVVVEHKRRPTGKPAKEVVIGYDAYTGTEPTDDTGDDGTGGADGSGTGTDPTDGSGGKGDDAETDECGGCGVHGTCDVATLTCVCSDEYYGPMCSLRDCGAHGAYAQDAEVCVCEPGYTGALCDECGGAPAGEKFLCMGRGERYNIVAFKEKEASGFLHLKTMGFTFFEPGSNPAYDCGCKHLDSAAARFLPRVPLRDLSEQEILDAFNAISVETINQQQTTSEELADIVRANNRDRNDCKWETVMPILILGALGTVFLAIVLVIVIAWGIWYTKPRKQQ